MTIPTIGSAWRYYRDEILQPSGEGIDALTLLSLDQSFHAGAHAMLLLMADLAGDDDKIAVGKERIDSWFTELASHQVDLLGSLKEAIEKTADNRKRP